MSDIFAMTVMIQCKKLLTLMMLLLFLLREGKGSDDRVRLVYE